MNKTLKFPEKFLWGTATAAHQIEGNNKNSDWWVWEQSKNPKRKYPMDPSDLACDSYNRYEEDFDLAKQANNNCIRFSVEWARIEPQEGKFNREAIEHYKKVIKAAKIRGLRTFVTLHHFTNPIWFAEKRGWLNSKAPEYFTKYAEVCTKEFAALADYFITINEPQVISVMAYTFGFWPPEHHNPFDTLKVQYNFLRAHRMAYKAIKRISDIPVGIAMNVVWWTTTERKLWIDRIASKILSFLNTDLFVLPIMWSLDFIGLNYYFTKKLEFLVSRNTSNIIVDEAKELDKSEHWFFDPIGEHDPEGLKQTLHIMNKYKLPIYITENGLADAKDQYRPTVLQKHLIKANEAIQEGVDLKGFMYWSLLDNYEWHLGYKAKFGLVEIDRNDNLKRKPRNSFHYYSEVCKNNSVESYDELAAHIQEKKTNQ